MANVPVGTIQASRTAKAPVVVSPMSLADTYRVPNTGRTILHFKKSGAGACVVTVKTPLALGNLAVAEDTFNVPALTGDVYTSGYDTNLFNVQGTGYLELTVSEVTGLSLEVIEPA